jgi:hypothetical protein
VTFAPNPRLSLRSRRCRPNLLPQPCRERGGIETDRVSNFKTGDTAISGKLVNLALTDIQQRGYIRHGESCRPFFERVGEIHMSRQSPRLKTPISISRYALNASHSNDSLAPGNAASKDPQIDQLKNAMADYTQAGGKGQPTFDQEAVVRKMLDHRLSHVVAAYAPKTRHVYRKEMPTPPAADKHDKMIFVTSHRAVLFVGGLWAVQPGSTAIRGNERKQCAICETCKPASSTAFR